MKKKKQIQAERSFYALDREGSSILLKASAAVSKLCIRIPFWTLLLLIVLALGSYLDLQWLIWISLAVWIANMIWLLFKVVKLHIPNRCGKCNSRLRKHYVSSPGGDELRLVCDKCQVYVVTGIVSSG